MKYIFISYGLKMMCKIVFFRVNITRFNNIEFRIPWNHRHEMYFSFDDSRGLKHTSGIGQPYTGILPYEEIGFQVERTLVSATRKDFYGFRPPSWLSLTQFRSLNTRRENAPLVANDVIFVILKFAPSDSPTRKKSFHSMAKETIFALQWDDLFGPILLPKVVFFFFFFLKKVFYPGTLKNQYFFNFIFRNIRNFHTAAWFFGKIL